MIEIVERNFEAFFQAPFAAYGDDSLYVSPMKSDLKRFLNGARNPVFTDDNQITFFTAHRNGRVLGRITAHVHSASNSLYGENRAYFGYFDCSDDQEVATALLTAAEDWAERRGFDEIAGNFNLTAMQQIGVQTDGFERAPYTDLVYSPPHIHKLLEAAGYERLFPMTTFESDLELIDPSMLMGPQQRELEASPDFTFAPINRRTLCARIEEARVILNDAFADNPMFVPVSAEEFDFQARDLKWIVDPRISAVLYHRGEAIATIICIPDLNPFLKAVGSRLGLSAPWHYLRHKMRCDRAVLIFSAVRRAYHGQGVNPFVLHRVLSAMKAAGYRHAGGTWIADVNKASLRQREKMGATPLHRLHLYRKQLTSERR